MVLDGDRGATLGIVPLQLGIGQDIRRLDVCVGLVTRTQNALIKVSVTGLSTGIIFGSHLMVNFLILNIVCCIVNEEIAV